MCLFVLKYTKEQQAVEAKLDYEFWEGYSGILTPEAFLVASNMLKYPTGYTCMWDTTWHQDAPPEIIPVLEAWARAIDMWEPV